MENISAESLAREYRKLIVSRHLYHPGKRVEGDNGLLVGFDRVHFEGGNNCVLLGGAQSTLECGDDSLLVGGYLTSFKAGTGSKIESVHPAKEWPHLMVSAETTVGSGGLTPGEWYVLDFNGDWCQLPEPLYNTKMYETFLKVRGLK